MSGNAAEQQLKGLQGSTMYTVTVTSQLGNLDSSDAITAFTTTGGQSAHTPSQTTLMLKPINSPETEKKRKADVFISFLQLSFW